MYVQHTILTNVITPGLLNRNLNGQKRSWAYWTRAFMAAFTRSATWRYLRPLYCLPPLYSDCRRSGLLLFQLLLGLFWPTFTCCCWSKVFVASSHSVCIDRQPCTINHRTENRCASICVLQCCLHFCPTVLLLVWSRIREWQLIWARQLHVSHLVFTLRDKPQKCIWFRQHFFLQNSVRISKDRTHSGDKGTTFIQKVKVKQSV
jgi:hypothetical protein